MERVSRLLVIGSIALAGVTHAWLVDWQPGVRLAAGATFAALFLLARISTRGAVAVVTSTTFVAPALLGAAFGAADYHQIIVWIAGVTGLLAARANLQKWSVPSRWTTPLALWAVVVATTWPIVAAREVDFSVTALQSAYSTNPLLQASPRLAAAFVVILALTQLVGLAWLDFLYGAFRDRDRDFGRFVATPLIAGAIASAVAGIYQRFIDPSWSNLPIWSNMERAGGLMNDANAFGTGAAFVAPAVIALAWFMRWRPWLPAIAMMTLTAGMWSAGSRTALLVFACGTGALAIALLRERGIWQPGIGRMVSLIGIGMFVLAAALVPRNFESSNPIERAFARIPRLDSAEMTRFATELWVRFGYGRAATQMLLDHPVAGVGVGAFHVLAPDYIFRDTGRIVASDNAQNWWRHQLAELGLVGGAAAMWFSVVVALLCRPRRREADRVATVLRGSLIGVGLASMLGVPTQSPALSLAFTTVVFWLAVVTPDAARAREASRPSAIITVIVTLIVAAGLALSARTDLRVPFRALRAGVPYFYGLTPPQEVSAYGELRWMGIRALWVRPSAERWLRLTVTAPSPDVNARPVQFELHVHGRRPVARTIGNNAPVGFFIDASSSATLMMELRASREFLPGRALQIATSWHPVVPQGVPDDQVIR